MGRRKRRPRPHLRQAVARLVNPRRPIDQIQRAIDLIKTNPDSRRILVSAWNVGELEQMALMPCHCLFQFFVARGRFPASSINALATWAWRAVQHRQLQPIDHDDGPSLRLAARGFVWDRRRLHIYQTTSPRCGNSSPARPGHYRG